MDNNQINSLVDNSINNPSGISNNKDSTVQPVTPEGMPLNIENTPSIEQKVELHPEIEGKKENKDTASNGNNNTSNNDRSLTEIPISAQEPEKATIVDKTTNQNTNQPLETIDRLSIIADEDEKDFIDNVKAAHEHT